MYGTKTIAGSTTAGALAYTGVSAGWMALTAVVVIICGVTLVRLASSRPSQILTGPRRHNHS